jgi:hypothetical protein
MDADLANQPGPSDEFDQSSDNSDSPPLVSAKQLKRERTVEKARHTKLITKINQHIAGLGSKRELAVHRASLADHARRGPPYTHLSATKQRLTTR